MGPAGSGAYSEDLGAFAGFTAASYKGNLLGSGGRPSAHALCSAAFAGSHLCHAAEYIQSNAATTIPSAGAWIDPSTESGTSTGNSGMPGSGRYIYGATCSSWSDASTSYSGTWIQTSGNITNSGDCSSSRPLACCNTPTKPSFAGFTAASTTGSGGGRPSMHRLCSSAFAGSHFCHATEYIRANGSIAVPSGGAWIDPSTASGTSTGNSGMPSSGRYIYGATCSSWVDGSTSYSGTWIQTSGNITNSGDCSTSRPIACCF